MNMSRSHKPRQLAFAALLFLLGIGTTGSAQEFVWAPDFPVGSAIPDLSSEDQNGERQNFNSLKGEHGLIFLLNRSFDW